jgi:hypothetical protein
MRERKILWSSKLLIIHFSCRRVIFRYDIHQSIVSKEYLNCSGRCEITAQKCQF